MWEEFSERMILKNSGFIKMFTDLIQMSNGKIEILFTFTFVFMLVIPPLELQLYAFNLESEYKPTGDQPEGYGNLWKDWTAVMPLRLYSVWQVQEKHLL